ncbi:GntR family transcriptional regulator [Planobispora longispora]|uniref:GntR family transcriptional regulator n=1 Tax=Planobispora longispora TaxID=28887 RepID=A0A8J3RXY8_9ACTN|nr:GntR family transcriptional regulator [Planobispora longispora]BFE80871.1 GntR family transcriptional regulator [Planobispora longispora]GIH80188.1 GntR family transcriptional regulator [Planobispora longispora]
MDSVVSELQRDLDRLGRSSTAERVADILRDRIAGGLFTPGQRLSEEVIGAALKVSRNTLREAFRLLGHERLLEHRLNRGVFVRVLSAEDVADLYRVRRVIEGAAVRRGAGASHEALAAMEEAVAAASRAAAEDRWQDVGTANIRFHQALAALNGSPRLDETMRQLLAELRLVFHVMENPRAFHEPFVARNRELVELMAAGRTAEAERALERYLDDAEELLMRAYTPRP